MQIQLDTGILKDRRLDVVYMGSIEGEPYPAQIIEDARRIGASFLTKKLLYGSRASQRAVGLSTNRQVTD